MGEFLQKEFGEFHQKITQDDYGDLRDKREMLIQELRDWLKQNNKPGFDEFNQGSYAMKTTIKPLDGEDYDIDVGLEFNLSVDQYKDPTEVKQWVIDAFSKKQNRNVIPKKPCVRVQYIKDGEPRFHLDFAVYGRKDINSKKENLYLAIGKPNSGETNRKWDSAEPFELKEKINKAFEKSDEQMQMRRCIRALKRWKDFKFSDGNGRPTGIAITAMALKWFNPYVYDPISEEAKVSDLKALSYLVSKIESNNYGLDITLPVKPGNDLFSKMKNSETYIENYKKKLKGLKAALKDASEKDDEHDAGEILQKHFGTDFPIPPKKEKPRATNQPAIAPSIGSA